MQTLLRALQGRGLNLGGMAPQLGLGSTDPDRMSGTDFARLADYTRRQHPEAIRETVQQQPWFVKAMGNPIVMGALGMVAAHIDQLSFAVWLRHWIAGYPRGPPARSFFLKICLQYSLKRRMLGISKRAKLVSKLFMATAIQERERWLFLSNLAEQILAADNPLDLIRASSRKMLGLVDADVLLHYLVLKKGSCMQLDACEGIPSEIVQRIRSVSFTSKVCQTGMICDLDHPPREGCPCKEVFRELINHLGAKCFACHPLTAGDRVVGTLAFGSRSRAGFVSDDLELMRTMAAQLSMAIYRIENEQNLREAEERLRGLSEATFEGILISEKGIIIDLNQQMADLVGWPLEELRGREILSFVAPEDQARLRDSFFSKEDRLSEYQVVRKDGSRRIFEAHGRPALFQGVLRRVAAVRDITERKRMEAELLRQSRELQELNAQLEQRVKDRTLEIEHLADQLRGLSVKLIQAQQKERQHLATLLHDDIQQLLVAGKLRVNLCLRNPRHPDHQTLCQETYQILQEALDHCRSLVVELYPPVLQQRGLVGGLHWLADQSEHKHRFRVSVQADPQAEPSAQELRCFLFESARELLLNAVKYSQSPHGGRITLSRTPEQEICLCVEDGGIGFVPGRPPDQTASGFGLFSIQQRIAHIGGRMEIDSAPGLGTRITLLVSCQTRESSPA